MWKFYDDFIILQVEMLNTEKSALTQQPLQDKVLMMAQEKKMALCEICGSFLVANDAAERTQSHITGKQHMGYGMVRDFLSEYKVIFPTMLHMSFLHLPSLLHYFLPQLLIPPRPSVFYFWDGRKSYFLKILL